MKTLPCQGDRSQFIDVYSTESGRVFSRKAVVDSMEKRIAHSDPKRHHITKHTLAEASLSQELPSWIQVHVHAFEFRQASCHYYYQMKP